MSTPGKAGTVFPAARIVANPFATGIVVNAGALSSRAPGIKWNEPQSLGLDELDENASIASQIPSAAITPGKSILKTPRGKTPGGHLRSNDNNSGGGGGGLGTPVRTPGKTPGGSSSIRSLALRSRFAQAPKRVEIKSKMPARNKSHHHQIMIERERPRLHNNHTPGKGGGGWRASGGGGGAEDGGAGAQEEEEPFNPAAVLKTLPNATMAAYWLRRSAREEANGNMEEAMSFIEQGIKRHAEPNEELVTARDALAARIAAAKYGIEAATEVAAEAANRTTTSSSSSSSSSSSPSSSSQSTAPPTLSGDVNPAGTHRALTLAAGAVPAAAPLADVRFINNPFATSSAVSPSSSPEPPTRRLPEIVGSVLVVTPVRTPRRHREALGCGETVLTPVRRSARKGVSALNLEPGAMASMLESTGFAYMPNDALIDKRLADDEDSDIDGDADVDAERERERERENDVGDFPCVDSVGVAQHAVKVTEADDLPACDSVAARLNFNADASLSAGAAAEAATEVVSKRSATGSSEENVADAGADAHPRAVAAAVKSQQVMGSRNTPDTGRAKTATPGRLSRVASARRAPNCFSPDAVAVDEMNATPAAAAAGGTNFGGVKVTVSKSAGLFARFSGALNAAEQLTPGSEFAALEAAAEAEAASEEQAAREAQAQTLSMLIRQESLRSSGGFVSGSGFGFGSGSGGTPVNGSPRKPPKSPSAKKASALARAAVLAAANVHGGGVSSEPSPAAAVAAAAGGSMSALSFVSPAGSAGNGMVSPSILMPDLPTPTLTLADADAAAAFGSFVPPAAVEATISAAAAGAAGDVLTEDAEAFVCQATSPGARDGVAAAGTFAAVVKVPSVAIADPTTAGAARSSDAEEGEGGAARVADAVAVAVVVSPTAAVAEAFAATTPGSINTRRRRPRRTPSPIAMAPDTAADSPADPELVVAAPLPAAAATEDTVAGDTAAAEITESFSSPVSSAPAPENTENPVAEGREVSFSEEEDELTVTLTPATTSLAAVVTSAEFSSPAAVAALSSPAVAALAPNAAAALALDSSCISPLSVFARMMAKVINDAAADIKSHAEDGVMRGEAAGAETESASEAVDDDDDAAAGAGAGASHPRDVVRDEKASSAPALEVMEVDEERLSLPTVRVTPGKLSAKKALRVPASPGSGYTMREQSGAGEGLVGSVVSLTPVRTSKAQRDTLGDTNAAFGLTPTRRSARKAASDRLSNQSGETAANVDAKLAEVGFVYVPNPALAAVSSRGGGGGGGVQTAAAEEEVAAAAAEASSPRTPVNYNGVGGGGGGGGPEEVSFRSTRVGEGSSASAVKRLSVATRASGRSKTTAARTPAAEPTPEDALGVGTRSAQKPMGRVATAAAAALAASASASASSSKPSTPSASGAEGEFTPRRSSRLSSTPGRKWTD